MVEKEFNEIVGKNLTFLMEERGISQNELARRLSVSPTSVNNWCNGLKLPRMKTVDKICSMFNIQRSDLINEDPTPETKRSLSAGAQHLLEIYNDLNEDGQSKLVEYAEDLQATGRYKKHDPVSEAVI